jgi:hypothetical protein
MIYGAREIEADLKALRRGWGIEAPGIESRIGAALRAAFGIHDEREPAQIRKLVAELLNTHIDRLPNELAVACRAAFALDSDIRQRLLKDRVSAAAALIDRDARTVHRRIDAGIRRIAEGAARSLDLARSPGCRAGPPWRTVELHAMVVLDLPVPEVFELRRIMAEGDHLSRVDLEVTLTPPAGYRGGAPTALGLTVLYGGVLSDRVMKSTNRIGFTLHLPEPLDRGAEHEYALRVSVPAASPMAPHYVCTPRFPCDLFRLHVRFGPDRVPESVWRLDAAPPLEIDDPAADRKPLSVNGSGEVLAVFTALEPHLSHGVAWCPTTAGGG